MLQWVSNLVLEIALDCKYSLGKKKKNKIAHCNLSVSKILADPKFELFNASLHVIE